MSVVFHSQWLAEVHMAEFAPSGWFVVPLMTEGLCCEIRSSYWVQTNELSMLVRSLHLFLRVSDTQKASGCEAMSFSTIRCTTHAVQMTRRTLLFWTARLLLAFSSNSAASSTACWSCKQCGSLNGMLPNRHCATTRGQIHKLRSSVRKSPDKKPWEPRAQCSEKLTFVSSSSLTFESDSRGQCWKSKAFYIKRSLKWITIAYTYISVC